VALLGTETEALGIDNVLILTDQGIVNARLLDAVLAPLEKARIKTAVYDQVAPLGSP
jgi:alcohol dehydrogenase class IV